MIKRFGDTPQDNTIYLTENQALKWNVTLLVVPETTPPLSVSVHSPV
jgi:hypothetical protein